MPDDPRVTHQLLDSLQVETRDSLGVEAGEGITVTFPLAQDGEPAQARLGAFQGKHFKQPVVIVHWYPPFQVVVSHVERVFPRPGAPLQF
jgi:hypothetical protein